jgi:hypothetical protein
MVAHGASRGIVKAEHSSCGAAKDIPSSVAPAGACFHYNAYPQLTPWATILSLLRSYWPPKVPTCRDSFFEMRAISSRREKPIATQQSFI